jgi:hypothetical protein
VEHLALLTRIDNGLGQCLSQSDLFVGLGQKHQSRIGGDVSAVEAANNLFADLRRESQRRARIVHREHLCRVRI